ncbi:MAG TPA: PKD domain-containing protein, partial [Bacteroidia bacterium]|nr:PKD domain-containing protein [Bacteroidia bacterium]
PPTGLSSTNGSPVTATPGATTSYTVSGTNANGCINTATTTVVVNSTPTITVNNGTTCNGGSVTLTANGASTYSWSPGTGLSATTGASVNASPPSTTNYTITGTDINGCINTGTTSVTVVTNPTLTVNTATICAGQQTATLTVNGATTYAWTPGTGLSGTTGSTVTGTPATTTVYTITGTAGTCTAVTTTTITVNAPPVVTVNSSTICVGQQTATLTANGASTYIWNPGTGLSSTNGSPVTGTPAATTAYTVTGTDLNGCTGTATSTITVNPVPTITVNNGLICNGGTLALNANGASTYTWSPGTGLSSTNGASVNANPTTTTQYTVVGTNANGCISSSTTTVTVVNNPTVTVTSSTICVGQQTATLTANGATTYNWTPATGLSGTTGATVTGTPATTTAYTITGTVGTCTTTGTATITVNPLPVIIVNTATICVGQQTATLTANGATTYTWIPGTGLSSTNGSPVTSTAAATTAYTVAGTNANGCINAATTTVTVNPLPNVTVNSGLICLGSTIALNANGAATYAWAPPAGLSATTGASVNANPIVTTVYTVTGTDANGCISSAPSTVTVVSNPTVTVNSATICLGQQTATLTANGATTYNWAPATGLSGTTGNTVTGTPATTTAYTITGTVGTCTAIGTATITVNPLPNITAASNSPVCVTHTLNLTSTNGVNYSWNGPNTFSSSVQNPSIPGVTMLAAGVYTVTGIDANNCVNTATVSVIINPLPVVTATGATVCTNGTINLSCTPNGASNYSWAGPLAYGSNIQNPTIPNANAGMAGSYVVTVTDGNGCVGANVAQVVVNPLPVVTSNSGTICGGQTSATLTATGANTYAWTPVTGLSSGNGAVVIANPNATTNYTVTGTDINGCKNTASVTVTVNTPPAVTLNQNYSGCAPVCITFSNTASGTGNCNWNFGDGSMSQSCNPNHCFTGKGTYTVTLTLTDNNGCINSATSSVNVYPVPHADFNATPQPTTVLESSISFHDASTGAVIGSWGWTFGDFNNNTSTIQNPVHLYGDTGSYMVHLVVISDHGCRDSTIKIIRIDDDYALYVPNAFSPNSDGVNDTFFAKGFGVKEFKMYIFDRWGEQIFFSDDINKAWDGRFQGKSDEIVQEDVYVWKIEAKNIKGEKKHLAGTVSLIK